MNKKNPWKIATIILAIIVGILLLNTLKEESSNIAKLPNNIEISLDDLCEYYKVYGLYRQFEICDTDKNLCTQVAFKENPCKE